MSISRIVISAISIVCFCSSGTFSFAAYSKPQVEIPDAWRLDSKGTGAVNVAWWEQFNDTVLTGLIHEALKNNRDLHLATIRIKEYYGLMAMIRLQLWPQINANGSGARGKEPPLDAINVMDAQVAASWELDVFGHLRNQTSAARAQVKGAEEFRTAVVLSLVSTVANAYLTLRASDQKLAIAQETQAARQGALAIIKLRFDKGIGTQVDVDQASIELNQAQLSVIDLQRAIAKQENAFREVNDALVDYDSYSKRIVVIKQAVNSLTEYAKLSQSRYDNGVTSYLEVLDAERNLYSGQIAYVETQVNIFTSLVNIYKVMGGGWAVPEKYDTL